MIRIVIIGTGNLATHLFNAFSGSEKVQIVQVVGRSRKALIPFRVVDTCILGEPLAAADLYLLAIKDDAIEKVALQIRNFGPKIHTSGAKDLDILPREGGRGVFYPLQSFTPGRELVYKEIPVCIESDDPDTLHLLRIFASAFSDTVRFATSTQRLSMHLAAVFVNNFTNHLYYIGGQLCEKNKLNFELLRPLIQETADKALFMKPYDAQTGPGRRGDTETLNKHLSLLDQPEYKAIYKSISSSITELYEE